MDIMKEEKILVIMMVVVFVLAIATMIIISAVNENNIAQITSGTVIDKYYYPPRISQTGRTISYSPAGYSVTVRGDNGITAVYDVTPEKYNEVKINDWYPNVNEELKQGLRISPLFLCYNTLV